MESNYWQEIISDKVFYRHWYGMNIIVRFCHRLLTGRHLWLLSPVSSPWAQLETLSLPMSSFLQSHPQVLTTFTIIIRKIRISITDKILSNFSSKASHDSDDVFGFIGKYQSCLFFNVYRSDRFSAQVNFNYFFLSKASFVDWLFWIQWSRVHEVFCLFWLHALHRLIGQSL